LLCFFIAGSVQGEDHLSKWSFQVLGIAGEADFSGCHDMEVLLVS